MRRLLLAALLLLCGCNTDPVGAGQQRRFPVVDSARLAPESLDSYSKYVPLADAEVMYLGRDDYYQSRLLIHFPVPDSALDTATACQLILHRADSSTMSFVCRPCSVGWNTDAATWRLADSVTHWFTPGGDYWKVDLGTGRLESDSLVLDLDVDELDSASRKAFLDNGLLFFPQDTGFVAVHSGASAATAPRIKLTFASNKSTTYNALDDTHLVDTLQAGGLRALAVGSGVAFRTWLYFNLDSIPSEATIAQAELRFKPDVRYHRSDTLAIGVRRLTEPYHPKTRNAGLNDYSYASYNYIVSADSDSVMVLDLRTLVQFWTTYRDTGNALECDSNFGLLLVAAPEYSLPFRCTIRAVGDAAPVLDLLYVMPPRDRFFR